MRFDRVERCLLYLFAGCVGVLSTYAACRVIDRVWNVIW